MDDLLALLRSFLPPGAALAGGPVAPRVPSVFAIEEEAVARAVPKRRDEFRSGRAYARAALATIGTPPSAIAIGGSGQPVWPLGIVGAITHSGGFAAAVVARAAEFDALGLDVEREAPLDPELIRLICRPEEHRLAERLKPLGIDAPKLLFVIKEAVYKAYFPRTSTFLEFEDVAVELDPVGRSFRAALVGPAKPALAERREFDGRFGRAGGYLAAFLGIAAQTPKAPR